MKASDYLDLTSKERKLMFSLVQEKIENYFDNIFKLKVTNTVSREEILSYLSVIDFNHPLSAPEAIEFITTGLDNYQVHTPHPSYFGLFNPAVTAMGVAADTLIAAYNPQLAAWSHSPLPNEIENRLIKEFGNLFFASEVADGTFTSGGAEANHTAILTAMTDRFHSFQKIGLQGISEKPVLYISNESHHSFLKAARFCGLGADSVRTINADSSFRMSTIELRRQIDSDIHDGFTPFLLIGTIGTTSCGAIDPLDELYKIAKEKKLWFHVDAAWGGAIGILPEFKAEIEGLSNADSITFDAHKWLSVPMGAGMFLTSHPEIMQQAFGIETAYMPVKNSSTVINPFHHSIQWSRRFIGLKLFLSLSVAGWDGYREVLRHMLQMGEYLKERLKEEGWHILNDSILPVVCFADNTHPGKDDLKRMDTICAEVINSGFGWISTTVLNGNVSVLRACITNYRTEREDIDKLIESLGIARNNQVYL
jgi:glutamate/tyrosine decarboxylase-like PLP-dependent enzyme